MAKSPKTEIELLKDKVASLETTVTNMDAKIDILTSKLDELTGGKRALMWVVGFLATLISIFFLTKDHLK